MSEACGQNIPQRERNKHHYIPVFYLKEWAGKDGRLCEFSRPYNTPSGQLKPNIKSIPVKPRRVYPDGTGFIKHLYRFPGLNPRLANYLESEFFLRVDNEAAVVMQSFLRGKVQFDQKSTSAWVRFLMSMFHRNRKSIMRIAAMVDLDYVKNLEEEIRPQYEAQREKHGEGPTWDEMIESFTDADFQKIRLMTLRKSMLSERVGEFLNSMIWTVAPRYSKYPMFTSDRPITMTALDQDNAHLVTPLTPNHNFFAAKNAETMHRLEHRNRSGGLAGIINNNIVRQARTYVYAIDDS
ncbi:MAG TPA: DUF4238 domain-containing protein [Stellaceae bacterium]|jgi:hypothetical protein